ncbi:MAG: hypothetical protein IJF67_08815 [Clostridia bacterium]|nr:hypothetical protein [Clostridia bacterium]
MKKLIRRAYITMNTRKAAIAAELKNDERGVSAIVATVLLLLIVVLMAAVFYDTIAEWFSEMMEKIFDTADPQGMGEPDFGGN